MGLTEFTASGGWLDRFKKLDNLDFKARKKRANGMISLEHRSLEKKKVN